jgi:probable F420-dependent oxidoreductase
MLLDARLTEQLPEVGQAASQHETDGYAGAWIAETAHDPFLAALLALKSTSTLQVGTSVAIAFARSPMTVATTANDLHRVSGGRFALGLGTQVKAHIERRYSMPWSAPAARMREYVLALRAIWTAWNEQTPLEFRGSFYRHDLMTPFFSPAPNPHGAPKVLLGGVGPMMTEVAGSVADGFFCHTFTTEKYLRTVTLPALLKARTAAGLDMSGFEVCGSFFAVTGRDEEEFAAAVRATKRQLAFYASTPSYRGVLELHGWADLQNEVNALAKAGQWSQMQDLISDEMLATFALVADPGKLAAALRDRFGDVVSRCSLNMPGASPAVSRLVLAQLGERGD